MLRKLIAIFIFWSLLFTACTKEEPEVMSDETGDVVFALSDGDGLLKSGSGCAWDADYAMVILSYRFWGWKRTITHFVNVHIDDGVLYTEPIQLRQLFGGQLYKIEEFILYADDDQNQENPYGDRVVSAVPHDGSMLGEYIENPLNVEFAIDVFHENEIGLSVFCFDNHDPEDYGFIWFQPTVTILKQKWFYGDFCSKSFEDYAGSLYDIGKGVTLDMPAIFKVKVYRDDNLDDVFSEDEMRLEIGNESDYLNGVSRPISVAYSESQADESHFELRFFVYLKTDTGFQYVNVGSLFFENNSEVLFFTPVSERDIENDQAIIAGNDNIYEFVVGNCNTELGDFVFAH